MKRSLGVYIHIPFCNGKCKYCDFVSGVYDGETKARYFSELKKEIAAFDFSDRTVETVYFGGGTPSSAEAKEIADVMRLLGEKTTVSEGAEVTVECNPESLTAEKCETYRACGVNRVSMGLQAATDSLLERIGRLHTVSDFIRALDTAERYFSNISADLMIGLPGQTVRDVRRAVRLLVGRNLKHVSVYALTVEKGTPLAAEGYVPNEDESAEFYDVAVEDLLVGGFRRYEVSNFAVPGFESRHNSKYWAREPYVGFGVAAHSFLSDERIENTRSLSEYLRGGRAVRRERIEPDGKEAADETVMLALRTAKGLDTEAYRRAFGRDILKEKANEIAELNGFLTVTDGRLRLTDRGFYVMNEIIVRLTDD